MQFSQIISMLAGLATVPLCIALWHFMQEWRHKRRWRRENPFVDPDDVERMKELQQRLCWKYPEMDKIVAYALAISRFPEIRRALDSGATGDHECDLLPVHKKMVDAVRRIQEEWNETPNP